MRHAPSYKHTIASVVPALVFGLVMPARAQLTAAGPTLSVAPGASQFDLSGTGTAPMVAVRVALPFAHVFIAEGGAALARPDQQFGATTTLVIPEVGLQVQMPRRIASYLGVGIGEALDFRDKQYGGTLHNLTASGALGVRAGLTARAGAIAELRVRGIGSEFNGSAAEWTVGGLWRF